MDTQRCYQGKAGTLLRHFFSFYFNSSFSPVNTSIGGVWGKWNTHRQGVFWLSSNGHPRYGKPAGGLQDSLWGLLCLCFFFPPRTTIPRREKMREREKVGGVGGSRMGISYTRRQDSGSELVGLPSLRSRMVVDNGHSRKCILWEATTVGERGQLRLRPFA